MTLTIGSLFSGIGGLELGLEMAGLGPVVWQVERDPYCQRVLAKHWPDVPRYNDVKQFPPGWFFGSETTRPDLICGGFPCQDISAGNSRGSGLAGSRSGLWWQFERVIEEMQPGWVIVENVASAATRWVPAVGRRLEQIGYATFPIPLAARYVGAPHERARVFIIANTFGFKLRDIEQRISARRKAGIVSAQREAEPMDDRGWPSVADISRADDGVSGVVDRNRALGNAVVPAVAEVVGRVVRELAGC